MTKKMLIDAAQSEEIRVAVIDGNKVEDFDFESSARKPLRGNIYLARITRVEPSLQAAFVEYGGNRHGFLAFSEIHPDYYQIPVSDREALQESEREITKIAAELDAFQRGEDADGADHDSSDETESDHQSFEDRHDDDSSAETVLAHDDDNTEAEDKFENNEIEDINEDIQLNTDQTENLDAEPSGPRDFSDFDDDEHDGDDSSKEEEEEEEEDPVNPDTQTESPDSESPDSEQDTISAASDEEITKGDAIEENASEKNEEENNPDSALLKIDSDVMTDSLASSVILSNSDSISLENGTTNEENAQVDGEEETPDEEDLPELDEASARRAARRAEHNELLEKYREARRKHSRILRSYKIQEVIKPRQILLIQVVKEERGNKGAALTSYMSLAGRYCVLMPNTARGGGISRKIPSASDRKRLRRIVNDFDVKQGMGLIIRTAGAKRTKVEIKRDYDYLMRLWDTIRELTMKSVAPYLIYEEASLIKRAIRDLYDKDISKVLVEGEDGYREAKDFMKMLMPSHAKNIQRYKDATPLFMRYDVEQQLDMMYQPTARLKSGGYLVINQTEALIAVDVNSGKATRERNIEATALKTNLEAAKEVARQAKLRDLAGLIVIDFIDMEESKNNRAVERRLKESMKTDRARIQIGRISSFGLMELSRQRRRSGIVDGTTSVCPTCHGSGAVRSHETAALRILRAIEAEAIAGRSSVLAAKTSHEVALYILNHKREWLSRIEEQYAISVEITADPQKFGDQYEIEKRGPNRAKPERVRVAQSDFAGDADEGADETRDSRNDDNTDADGENRSKKRRRRRRKKGADPEARENGADSDQSRSDEESDNQRAADNDDESKPKKRRRRGRRGGRKHREGSNQQDDNQENVPDQPQVQSQTFDDTASNQAETDQPGDENASTAKPGQPQEGETPIEGDQQAKAKPARKKRAPRKKKVENTDADLQMDGQSDPQRSGSEAKEEGEQAEEKPKRKRTRRKTASKASPDNGPDKGESKQSSPDNTQAQGQPADSEKAEKPAKKDGAGRKGWWQRAIGG